MLDEHMRETHRIFKCSICDFKSSSVRGLKVHITKSHTKYEYETVSGYTASYPCNKCVFSSDMWDVLLKHMIEEHSGNYSLLFREDFLTFDPRTS